jgi:SAM-dependent methyltransferase
MAVARNLIAEPDPAWERFAAREPYFAVLTAPTFLRANLTSEAEREFFESGENYVHWILHIINQHLVPAFAPVSTLEYGCGVGRLAIPFARRAGHVVAADRSPTMLALARREAERRAIQHLEFQSPHELFASGRKFDLINCYGVFQRLPPDVGLELLDQLVECLGSGGVAVLHFPYRATTPGLVAASRRLRAKFPLVNGLSNALRGKPFDEPFVATHAYDLDEVFGALDRAFGRRFGAPIAATHLLFESQRGFSAFIAFVEAPLAGGRPAAGKQAEPADPVDVRELIARTSVEDLNRMAEQYFSTLQNREHHLAKPFNNPEETPTLLEAVAVMLQGLRLAAGMTVLEFGAGTGWLARFLTQLGCRVILLDVSPSALAIARDLYDRQPVIGERPEPRFLTFDGRHIELPDESVDRIVCFHAFHHAPNPEAVLEEFGRLLRPGGVAGFAEPGSRHSQDPQSQFEMRAYRVVENDVDVHALWRTARSCGFADIRLAVHHAPAFHVSLREFEDFLTDGGAGDRWVDSTRAFLRHVRSFFLIKAGTERIDSRLVSGLACRIEAEVEGSGEPGTITIDARVTNTGKAVWLAPEAEYGGVTLGIHLYDASGTLLSFDLLRQPLTDPPREIVPGESVTCRVTLVPPAAGRFFAELDCVSSRVIWFSQAGSTPVRVGFEARGA